MYDKWRWTLVVMCMWLFMATDGRRKLKRADPGEYNSEEYNNETAGEYDEDSCQCGVFMSLQVGVKEGRRGRPRGPPEGDPVVTYDTERASLPCGPAGNKFCINKCVDVILTYLSRAGPVICGAVERDVDREHAYLFIKNCGGDWKPTHFSAGKQFCCTDGEHHPC